MSDEIRYLAESISKQSIESMASFLLISKNVKGERLKKELLSKKEPELEDLEIFSFSILQKYGKFVLKRQEDFLR